MIDKIIERIGILSAPNQYSLTMSKHRQIKEISPLLDIDGENIIDSKGNILGRFVTEAYPGGYMCRVQKVERIEDGKEG